MAAVVLTFNEELNIERCLRHVAGRVEEIVIVDSFSTDRTLEIAGRFTDRIVQHRYEGHPQQWAWTLREVQVKSPWIFALDADFVVTEPVWGRLRDALERDTGAAGFYVRHLEVFRGRPIRHGGVYPAWWLRIFRKDKVRVDEQERVDVHFFVDGPTAKLEADVEERNEKDDNIYLWIEKQNRFARSHAAEELERRRGASTPPISPALLGSPDQRKLWLKGIWYHLPLFIRPVAYFIYRYVLRLGFLDGKAGFTYHFTQGLVYRMLVDFNIDEMTAKRDGRR